ncbi:MAG: hypothetical protein WAW06_05275 [bacterium]
MTKFFSLLLKPFEGGHAYGGIIFISILTGAVMLALFKLTSNQKAMKEVKTRISAYFLEMRLYKDDVSCVMASQRRILLANLGYMKLALLPAVVLIVPVVLIMIQLNLRYAFTGLEPGQTALVKVILEEGVDPTDTRLTLSAGEGLEKASPSVRIVSLGEVDWKVRLISSGVRDLRLSSDEGEMTFAVSGTRRLVPVYSVMKKASIWEVLLNPGAPAVPKAMPVKSVEVKYAPMSFDFGLFKLSWLWTFLIVSMAFGVVLKFIFKVE